MALGDDYASVDALKARLNIPDTQDDTQLNSALATASRGIEHFCNRQFNQTSSPVPRQFNPRHWWIAEVDDIADTSDLEIATDLGDDGTFGTVWNSHDYQLEPLSQVVAGVEGWPYWKIRAVEAKWFPQLRRGGLRVTATWGWPSVPAPVKEAALIVAEETFKLKDAPFGVAGFGEFGSVRIRQNPKVAQMLAPYRRDPVLVG